ncbi:nuclease SbcCD subunit D [Luteitalea sp. TBR-22]|uniref:metallophosphoesterase family protein n=1 Tax=Luteitalea sp. TBR-22 TaxID=2802971 RepID=UPI001AF5FFD8|nr:exonuclease subunit SbcD [Luteitalea sp. TBR-22]BCS35953.1 nuclease SbcCD subunit D [Luteitalea sp. TBR-22]
MRILHTSDWHAGKAWKGQSRLDELAAVLDDLADVVERERIDLVLMTGDVFDTPSPPAEAERIVFGFFRRIGRLDVPSVLIAGNHDSPARVEAWAQLAELARVTARGVVRHRDQGGRVAIETASGEAALVAMIPFVSAAQVLSAEELGAAPDAAMSTYAARMQQYVSHMCAGFGGTTVNLLLAHTHLDGAVVGKSERRMHVGDDWAAQPQVLPSTAHYVALGHIHRHQCIEAAPAPTWYAGAPMQLDFGEEGEAKAYNVIDARPGQPARVEARPYVGARPLRTIVIPGTVPVVADVDLTGQPHLRVVVDAALGPVDPDINRRVRDAFPGVVSVELRRAEPGQDAPVAPRPGTVSPRELYQAYVQQSGGTSTEATLAAFDALYAAALREEEPA